MRVGHGEGFLVWLIAKIKYIPIFPLPYQTCYPPGTTLKRLVVLARQVD
jgi:hypothetical protein